MKPWLNKLKGSASKSTPKPLPRRQDRVVRAGNKNDAEAWRGAYLALMRYEAAPDRLYTQLLSGIENRAWTMLCDPEGVRFRGFDRFSRTKPPWGLGVEPDVARACLERLHGKRATALALAPPSNMGLRPLDQQNSHSGSERSSGHDQCLRAVAERAPPPVRRLCELGLLSFKQAAKLSPAKPSPEKVAEVESFTAAAAAIVTSLGDAPQEAQLEEARHHVRTLLPVAPPTPQAVLRKYALMSATGKEDFLAQLADELAREGRQLVITAVVTAAE